VSKHLKTNLRPNISHGPSSTVTKIDCTLQPYPHLSGLITLTFNGDLFESDKGFKSRTSSGLYCQKARTTGFVGRDGSRML